MAGRQSQTNDLNTALEGNSSHPWDFTAIDQDICTLRRLQLSPVPHAAIGGYVTALKTKQIEYLKHGLNQVTQDALQTMDEFNTRIRRSYSIDSSPAHSNDASKDNANISQILEHWRQLYAELVWRQREVATSLFGVKCIKGFKEFVGVISDSSNPEGDVMAGFATLFQGLSDIQIPDYIQLEKSVSKQIGSRKSSGEKFGGAVMEYVELMLKPDELPVTSLEPVSTSGPKMGRVKILGNQASSSLQNGLKHLRNRRADRDSNGSRASARPISGPAVHNGAVSDKIQQQAVMVEQTHGDRTPPFPKGMEGLEVKVLNFIRESVFIFTRVKEMVRQDCLNYITFIGGPQSNVKPPIILADDLNGTYASLRQDAMLQSEELKRMRDWAQLYESFGQSLHEFANSVVTVVGIDAGKSSPSRSNSRGP